MNLKKGFRLGVGLLGMSNDVDVKTDGRTWIFGGDAVYNFSLAPNQSWGVGLRYQPSRTSTGRISVIGLDMDNEDTSGTIWTHRMAILANYRRHFNESFFLGSLLGIDVFRSISWKLENPSTNDNFTEIKGSQFLGTGLIALEAGFKITPLFFVKAELGYSLLRYNDLDICSEDGTCNTLGDAFNDAFDNLEGSNSQEFEGQEGLSAFENISLRWDMSGIYALVGVGLSF